MSVYYDMQGQPMTQAEWSRAFENDNRIIAQTKVGEMLVSTVWLGLDHAFSGGPPLIFETMIFGSEGEEKYCERYSTRTQAVKGHHDAVQWAEERSTP